MKQWIGILAVVLAAVVVSPGIAGAKEPDGAAAARHDEKIANVRKLVHVLSGKQLKDMTDKMVRSTLEAMESRMPPDARDDPETRQALDEYMKSLSPGEKDLEEMLDFMVPYYDKYLDEADIAELVRFYESPAGKNLIRVMPEMMGEMMPQLIRWQMEKLKGPMETLQKRLEAIGKKKSGEAPPSAPQG